MDDSLVLALVSTGAAVLNGIGLLMTWMKYRSLASESLIFASEVLGALHGREEDYPPPDLAARALSIIGKISLISLTGFRNRDILSDATRMCRDKQVPGAWRTGPITVHHNTGRVQPRAL